MNLIIVNFIFVSVLVLGAIYFFVKSIKAKKSINWEELAETSYSLISIMVPKNNEKSPLAAEQMFAALHGIFRPGSTAQPQLSFEIVSKNKQIIFYAHVPTNLKDFVVSQLYAQYPNIEIKMVDHDQDYVHLHQDKHIAATELELKRDPVYPIKTFLNFEVDPLSAITGVLSSLSPQEEVWIQMIIRPIDDAWQEKGIDVIKEIKDPPKHKGFREIFWLEMKTLTVDLFRHAVKPHEGTVLEDKKDEKPKDIDGPVQQAMKGIEEKITKLGYETNVRILAAAPDTHFARAKLEQVVGAFKQFNAININSFGFKEITNDRQALELFASRSFGKAEMIFNITELASLYHFPSETVSTPTITWAGSKKGEPPPNIPLQGVIASDELTVFAQTNFRNHIEKFGIKKKDRRLHMYAIGKTGTGKSTMLENMIVDDIREGRGVAVVDPHGETIQHVLDFIPEDRVEDVIYFNPADADNPVGFNLLENVDPELKNVVASGVVGIFKRIFGESWGPRLEYILRNDILALLEYPNSSLLGVMRILTDAAYRRSVINVVHDPVIRDFFINEYEKYDPKFRTEAIAPIQNKVGQFLSSSTIRNIVGQPKSTMNIEEIMNSGKILLADFSVGRIGEDNAMLLGSMLITKIQLAAMSRAHMAAEDRRDFYLYVDEFQNFATDSFATILSEARKYHLNLVMTNQYITQLSESVANAIFGNIGTLVSFRVGAQDADVLVKEVEPIFDANDLVNLDNYHIYLKMAIDGVTVPAFSATTLPPRSDPSGKTTEIIEASRRQFTRPRHDVEDYIAEWSEPVELNAPAKPAGEVRTSEVGERPKKITDSEQVQDRAVTTDVESVTPKPDGVGEKPEEDLPEVITPVTEAITTEKEAQEERAADMVPTGSEGERKTDFPDHLKVEILKDRFGRPWYAVKDDQPELTEARLAKEEQQVEQVVTGEASTSTDISDGTSTQSDSRPDKVEPAPRSSSEVGPAPRSLGEVGDYAPKTEVDQVESDNTMVSSGSGGEPEKEDQLITWEKAEELGITDEPKAQKAPKSDQSDDDFLPVDEIS